MSGDESGIQSAIQGQAIDWHIAQGDMPESRWEDFIAWLEADPAHARAYDMVAADDRMVAEARFPVLAANDDAPLVGGWHKQGRWRWMAGGGIAAAFALLLVPVAMPPAASTYTISTKPGERRTVQLPDGSTAELSGDTTLRLDRNAPRRAELAQGEATLHVRHDAANPFSITSHGLTVQDVGTVFNVARDGRQLAVAVAEGSVLVEPKREAVTLKPGDAIVVHEDTRVMTRSKIAPDAVGGWRNDMLSFGGEPLEAVAAAVHRRDDAIIILSGGLSNQPFTGIVRLTGKADRDVPHLAALIGADVRRDGERWILASGGSPQ